MLSQVRVGYNGGSTDRVLPVDVDRFQMSGPSGFWEAIRGGQSTHLAGMVYLREKAPTMPLVTVCRPLCGGTVAGEDKTALGNHLNKHWTDDHHIRPTLGAEAGIGKGKGH